MIMTKLINEQLCPLALGPLCVGRTPETRRPGQFRVRGPFSQPAVTRPPELSRLPPETSCPQLPVSSPAQPLGPAILRFVAVALTLSDSTCE